jgi:hypothetical protein
MRSEEGKKRAIPIDSGTATGGGGAPAAGRGNPASGDQPPTSFR